MSHKRRTLLLAVIVAIIATGCANNEPNASPTIASATPSSPPTEAASTEPPASSPPQSEAPTDPKQLYYERSIVTKGEPARIAAAMKRAKAGQPVTVGVIGGSITAGSLSSDANNKSWAALIRNWWIDHFPESRITFVNAGIGATGSLYGVHRVDQDLLAANPDFVVIEFSVNDMGIATSTETYEGLVRKVLKSANKPGVVYLNMMNGSGNSWQSHFTPVNDKYGIPTISYREAVWPKIQAGELRWSDIAADDVHPNDTGHAMAADLIVHYLDGVQASLDTIGDPDLTLPAPLTDNGYENATVDNNKNLTPASVGDWEAYSDPGLWGDGWKATDKGKPLVLDVTAGYVTVNFARFNFVGKGAQAYVMIDGTTRIDLNADFSGGWGNYIESRTLLKEKEIKPHRLEFYYDDEPYSEFRISSLLIANY
ncbi:SGNH/GDSL hydrolase family protein [Cohnella yongneupensis]|uniref:GDSL-type esterase/lipase family protein n=1 Tax=Cohnella yongneupensis TaxID=425006 RepID=A0ABW0QXU8_9BACL